MKQLLILLLFPLMIFAQDSTLTGDVDCDGEITSQDASLILQFVTNVIDELPCEENMTGLTPEQLQEIINMMDEQLNINYSGGGGSNYPAMISSISSETMHFGDAMIYCDGLEEDGYSDWFLPNLDQLAYAVSGGCDLPDERTENTIWSTSSEGAYTLTLVESGSNGFNIDGGNGLKHCRCVRFGEGETSEGSSGSSNSSGSGSSILGNSEQAITMISPMYLAEDFPEFNHVNNYTDISDVYYGGRLLRYHHAVRFCSELSYNGYDDWFLPSLNQILHYVTNNSNYLGIPNLIGSSSSSMSFWSSTNSGVGGGGTSPGVKSVFIIYNNNATVNNWDGSIIDVSNTLSTFSSGDAGSYNHCFCVR